MRLVVLVGVCVLFVGYDNGSVEAASFGLDSAQKIHATGGLQNKMNFILNRFMNL